jgi:hypothetical protein
MFIIHLTPRKYQIAVMAARRAGDPDRIHVGYESPPNLKVGDEVEVRVEGIAPQIGVVEIIKPALRPGEYDARQEALDRAADDARALEFSREFGIPLEELTRRSDEQWEEMKVTYWLILRSKE